MAYKLQRKCRIESTEKETHLLYVLKELRENTLKRQKTICEYVHCFNCVQNEITRKQNNDIHHDKIPVINPAVHLLIKRKV